MRCVAATAALLVSIQRSGFGLAAVFQQSSLPFAAVMGWLVLGEGLTGSGWLGIVLASLALFVLSWPTRGVIAEGGPGGAVLGLLSGALYAVALNAFRAASLALEPTYPVVAAVLTNSVTQAPRAQALAQANPASSTQRNTVPPATRPAWGWAPCGAKNRRVMDCMPVLPETG